MVRSAGVGAQLMAREGNLATLRMPSGEMRKVHVDCMATIGQVGNIEHENVKLGKAGRSRWLGRRPMRARRRDEPGRPSRWAAARASPRVAAIRVRRGASDQGAQDPHRTSAPTSTSSSGAERSKE